MQNPGVKHWEGAKLVLRYLKGTSDLGITYGGNKFITDKTKHLLTVFTESDWGSCN